MRTSKSKAYQLSTNEFNKLQGKYGFSGITREQLNTSLRDPRKTPRVSKKLERSIEASGRTLKDYYLLVRALRISTKQKELASLKAQGNTAKVTKMINNLVKGLNMIEQADAEFTYAPNGRPREYKYLKDTDEFQVTDEYGKTYVFKASAKGGDQLLFKTRIPIIDELVEEIDDDSILD